jgi:hypothetical protein
MLRDRVLHPLRHPGLVPGPTVPRELSPRRSLHGGPRHKAGVTKGVGSHLAGSPEGLR